MAEIIEDIAYQDPVPKSGGQLPDQHRAKLDSIVSRMIANKESDENIRSVVNDFKQKYVTQEIAQPKQPAFQVQVAQPTFRAIQQTSQLRPTGANEPIIIKKEEVGYIPDDRTIEVEKLKGKATEAHKKIHNELLSNDEQHEKEIREYRRDSYTIDNLRSDYKAAGQILSPQDEKRALQREKQRRYDMPVTGSDIEDVKTGTVLNEKNARSFIKKLNKADASASSWVVDKFNEISNDPDALERIPKIKNIEKEIKAGRVIYNPETGQAFKPVGVIGSAIEAVKQKNQLYADRDFLKNTENDAAILSEYKARKKDQLDEPIPIPKGKVSEIIGGMAGTPWQIYAAGALGSLGGPQAGIAAATIVGGREMSKLEYPATFWRTMDEMISQGVPEFEAVHKARHQADQAAEVGAITGAAMGLVGARMGAGALPRVNLSQGFRKAAFNVLKQNGYDIGKAGLEGIATGGVGVVGEIYKNKLAQSAGIKRDIDEGTKEVFEQNLLTTVALAGAIKLFKGVAPKNARQLMHGLSKLPDEQIGEMLSERVQAGDITQKAADETLQRINEYKEKDSQIPATVTEEARFKIQDNIDKLNELEQEKEATHKSLQEPIKEKIQKLTGDNLALLKEVDKVEKPETGLTKKQEKEAAEFAEELIVEGVLPDTYEAMIKGDPIGFWKHIAQQAQSVDDLWRPLKEPIDEASVREQFGDTVVDYAKELFPVPETFVPESVSVIRPGEINRPETITIKPKENAIQERSATPPIVDETPGSSQEVGAGISEPGEAAIPQEGQPTQEESGAPGQEGQVGEPPISTPPEFKGIHVEHPATQLSFHGLQEVANEFGYEDVKSRDRMSDVQERKNAEITANEWASKGEYQSNIDDLLDRIERREHVPTAKQRLILEQYLANERQKAREMPKNSVEYDRQLLKLQRIKDIGQIARQEAGATLRLPDSGTLPHPITDESSAMIAKMEANGVDKLTDQQKAEVESQVERYKKASNEANDKVSALEDQVAKIDAQKEFNKAKSSTKRTKKTTEDRIAYRKSEIEAAREALRKLRTGESGLSSVPLPGVRELVAIAPHVKNVMVDLIEQGVTELDDVIKRIHSEFKNVLDGITEKNIHDIIAGEYNKKKQPLSELQKIVQDLKYEARLINQLEALERGMPPKSERLLRQRNQRIKELKDQIKEKTREHEQEFPDYEKRLKAIKSRNETKIKQVEEKIKNGDFEKSEKPVSIFDRDDVKKQFPQLRDEALDAIARKEEVQHEYDLALLKDEKSKWTKLQHLGDFVSKIIHTSKSFVAGIDDSATFVQNGLAMLAHPKTGAKVFLQHWKEAFSEPKFKRELAAIHNSNDYPIMKASGLDIIEQVSDAAQKVSEEFEKNLLAGKFKIDGKEYHPWKYTGGIFERAFASMGNNMRVELFRKRMGQLLADQKTFETHPQEYKDAARVINELTARGKQNKYIEQASPFVTPILWAPRMLSSTFNMLGISDLVSVIGGKKIGTEGYYRKLTPAQRKFALGQLGRGIGMGVAIMGAAALGGAKVDYDPFSVTFGDIIAGTHHYNVFGRFMPVVKTIIQAASGRRDSKGGRQDLDNPEFNGKTRLGVIEAFLRGKVTPAVGTTLNLISGEDYFTHQKFGWGDVPKALLMPMSIKDLMDGWKNDGTWGLLTRFLPAFEGIKATDERDFKKEESGKTHKSLRSKHSKNIKRLK